ncbi:GNAT family N-acetyltransferase [Streptomyces sp. CAU 1734]|uniref:GNAT family N-acetyltransferase n=1 Tax=Streptomyces sp. CAU 1734 TaxID=3140360 RepID=UPI003261B306
MSEHIPQERTDVQVKPGTEADLVALTALYNHYIRETPITFDTTVFTPRERLPWLRSHPEDGPHRLLVARDTGAPGTGAGSDSGSLPNPAEVRPNRPGTDSRPGTDNGPDHGPGIRPDRGAPEPGGGAPGERPWGSVLGYATSSPLRPKAAYDTSVEVSVYCAPEAAGRGIGSLLYRALFAALEGEDVHRAYAGIAGPNEASARLHAWFGFRPVGTYREVGRKFGRYWDVTWYEKELGRRM